MMAKLMKTLRITAIFTLLSSTFLLAQDNFVEKRDCEMDYSRLNVNFDPETRVSTYYLNDQLFTGCAKEEVDANEKQIFHYVKNGKLERQVGYYSNGQKSRDMHFKDGFEHGLIELFFPDGTPYIREEYRDGRLHGSLKRWKNGQLVREAEFWYGTMIKEKLHFVPGEEKQERPSYKKDC